MKMVLEDLQTFDGNPESDNLFLNDNRTEVILRYLSETKFNTRIAFEQVLKILKKEERLHYSQITYYVFKNYENKYIYDSLTANIESLYEYANSTNISVALIRFKDSNPTEYHYYIRTRDFIFKLYDHINLACLQYDQLKQSDEEFQKKFNERFEMKFDESFNNQFPKKFNSAFAKANEGKTNELMKDMNQQLITLVGIFTALAFVIFGTITELGNAFNQSNVSILKLIMIGSIWGIASINLIFVFLFCVGNITNTSIVNQNDKTKNIFQRYSIIWWSNYLLISCLLSSLWFYYLNKRNYQFVLDTIIPINPVLITSIFTIVLVSLIIICF